jgi:hypothetical protein
MSAARMLGKLAPHPESTHPRVRLGNHLTATALPPTPVVVDYASKVPSWPMYLNDALGDCTCAGIGHSVQAWTAYAKGLVTLPDSAILNLYERMGYVPGDAATDNGAVEQDVLAEVRKNGVGGRKILAYAQVDHTDITEMKTALNLFGSVYLGAQMPQSAMSQTDAGQPWAVVPGSPIEGGHCFVLQRWDALTAPMTVVTWGQLQRVHPAWWLAYGDEAWVVITQDWFRGNGDDITGVNLASLGDEFAAVTGQPNPFRAPATGGRKFVQNFRDKLRKLW